MYSYDETESAGDVHERQHALQRLVEDPLYWREQDPEFRAYVENGFKTVYGIEEAERDATGRTVEPAPKPAPLPPFRPSVSADDVILAGGVGDNQPNRWRDVWKVQKGLYNIGHYALDLTKEKSSERSPGLDQSIRDFQREKREEIDGVLLPGGPTITRMKESLFGENAPEITERGSEVPQWQASPAAEQRLIRVLSPLLAPPNTPSLPKAQSPAQLPGTSDEGVAPAQAPGPALPSTVPQRPRTHREAEDHSMERLVPYPIIDLPETSMEKLRGPKLYRWQERRQSIIDNAEGRIRIRENPSANGNAPGYATHVMGHLFVRMHDRLIEQEAARVGLDPNLLRAIMYVEVAQGWAYGLPAEAAGVAESLYPMNIRPDLWSALGFAPEQFKTAETNIRAAALLLRRIHDRLENPTISKLATLYNSLPKDRVTDYGARVAEVYRGKRWREASLGTYP